MKVNKKVILIVAMLLLIFVFPRHSKAQVITKHWGTNKELTWSVNTKTRVLTLSGVGGSDVDFSAPAHEGIKYEHNAPWAD